MSEPKPLFEDLDTATQRYIELVAAKRWQAALDAWMQYSEHTMVAVRDEHGRVQRVGGQVVEVADPEGGKRKVVRVIKDSVGGSRPFRAHTMLRAANTTERMNRLRDLAHNHWAQAERTA